MYNRPRRTVLLALFLSVAVPASVAVAVPETPTPAAALISSDGVHAAGDGDHAAYVFPYFAGEGSADGEKIYLAVSEADDPTQWHTLNDGEPVLESSLGTEGLRDPFLVRSPEDGTYYMLATDLKIHPGGSFGDAAKGHIRISLCQPDEVLREAAGRLKRFVSVYKRDAA